MGDQLPKDSNERLSGKDPFDSRYVRYNNNTESQTGKRQTRHENGRDPFPTFPRVPRRSAASVMDSVFKRKPQATPRGVKSARATATFFATPEPENQALHEETDGAQQMYEEPIMKGYGAIPPEEQQTELTGDGQQGATPDDSDYAVNNDQWELVYKEGDGEAPRTSKVRFPASLQRSGSQYASHKNSSKAATCYFYLVTITYTLLIVFRIGVFLTLLVLSASCLSKLDNPNDECMYVLSLASPGNSYSKSCAVTTAPPVNQRPTAAVPSPGATAPPPLILAAPNITEQQPLSSNTTTRPAQHNGWKSPDKPQTFLQPKFSRIHAICAGASVLNSLVLCIFLSRRGQQIRIPQRGMLFNRLRSSKTFWIQFALMLVALLYDAVFLKDAFRDGSNKCQSSQIRQIRAWLIVGRFVSALDKVLALVVVCGFNYAKPTTLPRTRAFLKWMKAMYIATLIIYILDQTFSLFFEGLKASLQAVIRVDGSGHDGDSNKALLFMLILFAMAYRLRLLDVFTDKVFYRNKDAFDIPRNTA